MLCWILSNNTTQDTYSILRSIQNVEFRLKIPQGSVLVIVSQQAPVFTKRL